MIDVSERFPHTPAGVKRAQEVGGDNWADHINWWGDDEDDTRDTSEILALRALIEVAREDNSLISDEHLELATQQFRNLTRESIESIGRQAIVRQLTVIPYSGTEDPITVSMMQPNAFRAEMPA